MVELIAVTKGAGKLEGKLAEEIISYCARVSNPKNQENFDTAPKLLKYLTVHKHWSPFQMASMCLEIKTSRGIAAQLLRHSSFAFQEFSQRYGEAISVVTYPARRQDTKNKQNSIDDLSEEVKTWFINAQKQVADTSFELYDKALELGVAKEQARFLLPLNTETTLYMNGSIRSWMHFILVRTDPSTQKEHREIAEACKKIFVENFPSCGVALGWNDSPQPT